MIHCHEKIGATLGCIALDREGLFSAGIWSLDGTVSNVLFCGCNIFAEHQKDQQAQILLVPIYARIVCSGNINPTNSESPISFIWATNTTQMLERSLKRGVLAITKIQWLKRLRGPIPYRISLPDRQ